MRGLRASAPHLDVRRSGTLRHMPGIVFLSCGQNDRELRITEKVRQLLEDPPFSLKVFVARATNNLYSLNDDVLARLAYADYFLFVNFHRKTQGFSGSLYSHQELAMALALGHRHLLIFSERNAPNLGIIQFMVQNRPNFSSEEELLSMIRADVEREQWRAQYSRFLRPDKLWLEKSISFSDGTGNILKGTSISVVILNQSGELRESVMITLDKLDGQLPGHLFRSPLKVSGQRRYDAAIPPEASAVFNILIDGSRTASGETMKGTFLMSALDLSPLPPLFSDQEPHEMEFRLDARGHSPVRFRVCRRGTEYALHDQHEAYRTGHPIQTDTDSGC